MTAMLPAGFALTSTSGTLGLAKYAQILKYRYLLILETVSAVVGAAAIASAEVFFDVYKRTTPGLLANVSLRLFGKFALFSIRFLQCSASCVQGRYLHLEIERPTERIGQVRREIVDCGLKNSGVVAFSDTSDNVGGSLNSTHDGSAGFQNRHNGFSATMLWRPTVAQAIAIVADTDVGPAA